MILSFFNSWSGCCCLVPKLCPTLCDAKDCRPPGSSVHVISQARTLESVAISFSRGSSWPGTGTWVSCIGRQILLPLSHQESPMNWYMWHKILHFFPLIKIIVMCVYLIGDNLWRCIQAGNIKLIIQSPTLRKPSITGQDGMVHVILIMLVLILITDPLMNWRVRGKRDRGRDGWMASSTRWTWVWVNSGSWWWIGRPGVLQSMGSQRVRHDCVTELNWTRG